MSDREQRRGPGRRGGAARLQRSAAGVRPYITRNLPLTEVLSEEGLQIIEHNAETMLEEIGIEFRDHPRALELLKGAGADVKGDARALPPRPCPPAHRDRARASTPSTPATRSAASQIGGKTTVFAPVYGSPFVHDLDQGRRYGTIEDFRNFVKLAYLSPYIHHSGGTVCEPVDLPVNKRHLEMVYAHMRWSDKPFMGSVTHPDRAADTVAMAEILFGEEFLARQHRLHEPDQRQLAAGVGLDHARRGRGLCRRPTRPASSRRSSCRAR